MNTLRIAIDLMGGDMGVSITVPATLSLAKKHPNIEFHLHGEASAIAVLPSSLPPNILLVASEDSVAMDDKPLHALRRKRDSSMANALAAVANKAVDGCVSAGNTGALLALGMHFLGTFSGIDRPALCQAIPAVAPDKSNVVRQISYMLDLGANVDCSAEQLFQFACLGAALSRVLNDSQPPSLRLLNIGSEDFKGTVAVQGAAKQLADTPSLNYQGFIEANQLYHGLCDVIITDGFSGNIALKASEGVSRVVMASAKSLFMSGIYHRVVALLAKPILNRWKKQINPDRYNGAYLLGLKGTVVKSHGSANVIQFTYAVEMLIHQLMQQNTRSMESSLADLGVGV